MPVFGDYARYYNLLYGDKDYAGETGFVLERLRQLGPEPASLLDLGCGTGLHAMQAARRGLAVTGVDMSAVMLDMGHARLREAREGSPVSVPELLEGDARSVRLGRRFDAATSLFHVMSYQNSEDDALAVMITAREHLKPGGVFLFDFWYGPAVFTDPPEVRRKTMEDAHVQVSRLATPVWRVNENVVEVCYSVRLTDKASGAVSMLEERHSMRYWFLPELRHLAREAGMSVAAEGAWLSTAMPGRSTWNAWMALRRPA